MESEELYMGSRLERQGQQEGLGVSNMWKTEGQH